MFFALFGAVALVGVVGASSMQIMKGPVRSMSEVTKRTVAENNMIASAKLALIAATSQSDSGDCDADGFVEPIPFEASATGSPTGGGHLPAAIGAALNDPWDTRYGYCVWDHGAITAGCGGGNYLTGENGATGYAIALISAGPDRQFQTSCNAYPSAAALDKVSGSDDIVLGYTYGEASALAGGLWNLKSGDADTAEIDRNLEVKDESGNVTFALDAQSGLGDFIGLTTGSIAGKSGPLDVTGGLKFESDNIALNDACNEEDAFAFDTATDMLVRCDGSIWVPSGGSDNLGNHEATENIQLKGYWLSNDGGDEGLQLADDGTVSSSSAINVGTDLHVTGASAIGTTLDVTGATTLSTLSTSGLATLNSASVTQNAGIGGTLDVTGGTTLTSLTTSGAADLDSASITNALNVTGATTLSTLSTSGLSTLNSLAVTNNASVGGTLDMTAGKISNLLDPTLAQDAASKAYVDARVASGTGFVEADPQVGTIQSSKWCIGNNDGSAIVCDQNMPVPSDTLSGLSCSSGQIPKYNGTAWACAADNAGGGGGGGSGKGLVVVGSTTSLANGVTTNVAFSGTPTPNDFTGAWASNAFTVPTGDAGWYTIVGYVNLPNTSQHAIAYITVNGSNVAFSRDVSNTASNVIQYVNASAVTYLNEGDVVRLTASQAGGSTIALTNARLAIAKMGGGSGVADNLGDHIATQSVRLFKATGSAGTVVAGTGDDLGNHTATQALAMGGYSINAADVVNGHRFHLSAPGSAAIVKVGKDASNDQSAYIDLIGDTTYTDFGLRLIRNNSGANTTSKLVSRGTGGLYLTTQDAAALYLQTANTTRMTIGATGDVVATGSITAASFVGDGSGLTNLPAGAGDNLGNHTATQTLVLGTNWLNGDTGAEGISVSTTGQVRMDQAGAGNTYDVWIQGGAGTSGATRRLALLGTEAGMLHLNYAAEYASGVTIGGPITITAGALTDNSILTADIAPLAVTSAELAANAVITAKIADDAVTMAKLSATGTASSATFLRGDGAWATPASAALAVTSATCTKSGIGSQSCTATCPATYKRTGCSFEGSGTSGASPSGSTACVCVGHNGIECFAYCAK